MKAGLGKAGNVWKQTSRSPRFQIKAILIIGEYVKNPSPIAFSLPFNQRDD
jgi:hypothetical protein